MVRTDEDRSTTCNICNNGKKNYPLAILKAVTLLKAEKPTNPLNQLYNRFQKSSHSISQLCAPAC